MSPRRRPNTWMAFLVLLGSGASVTPVEATEPQVAFVLKAGWVECVLRQDGRPVADGVIQVMDDQGRSFAEGQTGPEGETAFPAPPGASFFVEIKTGNRTADPIRLFKENAVIEPARVLLTYGLRPCCRFKARTDPLKVGSEVSPPTASDEMPSPSPSPWGLIAAGVFGLFGVVLVLFALKCRIRAGEAPTRLSRN